MHVLYCDVKFLVVSRLVLRKWTATSEVSVSYVKPL